jgi:hypothetical protein
MAISTLRNQERKWYNTISIAKIGAKIMNNFFENAEACGKKFIKTCLVGAGVIGVSFVLFFVVMTLVRIASLCWDVLFGHSWVIK